MTKTKKTDLCLIGAITSVHGILGRVVLRSFTHIPQNIFQFKLLDEKYTEYSIKMLHSKGSSSFVCSINDIKTRTEAEALQGLKIFCLKESLPKIEDEDEFYVENLKGLPVLDAKSMQKIGVIRDVLNFGAGDILEIIRLNDASELILFTKENCPVVNNDYVVVNVMD